MKLDAHQHFWHYTPADYGWIGPDMQVLQKDHLPPNLALLTKSVDIEGTVAVQARQSLIDCAMETGSRPIKILACNRSMGAAPRVSENPT